MMLILCLYLLPTCSTYKSCVLLVYLKMFLPAGLITRQATSILKPAQRVVIANKSTNIPFSLILNEWVLA